jgi:Leucine rich repeat
LYQVLQLAALEILDLSRNKLRALPDEIRQMTSLKVLAIQRNRIERLPTSLGEMNRLTVLKVDENPLVFPPRDVLLADKDMLNAPIDKTMIHITAKIKKFLRQNTNSTNGRSRAPTDSDGEAR